MRLRLYLDEDISTLLARLLRDRNEDAISAHEIGALQWDDERQLAHAAGEQRTLLTSNCGHFLRIAKRWSAAGRTHSGIVISYRQYRRDQLGELVRAVLTLLEAVSAESAVDTVIVLDQFRPRIL